MRGSSGTATCALGANQSAIKRGRRLPYSLLLIIILLGAAILHNGVSTALPTAQPRSQAQWAHLYAALPLNFEANRGQTNPNVDFLARGQGYTLFLTGHESVLALQAPHAAPAGSKLTAPASSAALRFQLLGANDGAAAKGTDELPGKANYFVGNDRSKWHTDISTYAKVRYQGVYPGIDLVYYGTQGGQLEYDFVVAPGADPTAIRFALKGTEHVAGGQTPGNAKSHAQSEVRDLNCKIDADGDLVVKMDGGDVRLRKPVIYQPVGKSGQGAADKGQRTLVDGHYVLLADNQIGFQVAPYDHSRPLIVDPVLLYATYLGGSGGDIGYAIAVDPSFDAYVAGVTYSTNFPIAGAAAQGANQGNGDAFVSKINSAGTSLLFSTYLGGTDSDTATAIAIYAGSAYVTGITSSADFPTVSPIIGTDPFQKIYGGGTDAFVTQLDAAGSSLVYSTYLGGTGLEWGLGIAVDSAGNAYVTGQTQSGNFPILHAYQPGSSGSSDAFVTKLNVTGTALGYSTYIGGTSADVAQCIQVDSAGDAYIAGYTFSSNFPLVGALQAAFGGGADGFVAELKPDGSALTFSTFLGGTGDDRVYGIGLDTNKNVYVAGYTVSSDFPTTTGAYQTSLRGATNAFASKLNPTGSSLVYSTYLGGTGTDKAYGIAVTSAGVANVTGSTNSSDFPTQSPVQAVLGLSNNTFCGTAPCADAFVTQFNATGSALTYSTYLGGNGPDFGQAIAVDTSGDPYITGSTSSSNFPAIAGSYKSSLTGKTGNAFIAKLDPANNSNISIVPYSVNFGNETLSVTSPYQQITIANMSNAPLTISSILVNQVNNSSTIFTETDNCLGTIPAGGAYCTMNVAFTPSSTGQVTDTIVITDNAGAVPGTQQTITLTGSGVTSATQVTVSPTSLTFPSQSVGTVSTAQNVQVTNTGSQTLNITSISAGTSNDFSETDNCLTAPYYGALGVSQSCTVSVFFSPTASGTRQSALTINDNATGSPQVVALTGTGAAAFSLTSPGSCNGTNTVNPVIIGSTQTTYCLQANGPSSFNGAISLTCSSGSTCQFTPNPIFVGGLTVLTISNLSPSTTNPYPFVVTGTSGTQSSTLNMNLLFEDFKLTINPTYYAAQAGTPGKYTVLVNPLNGFNSQVNLACASLGLPPAATCTFSNANPTPNGTSPSSVALTVNTVKYVTPTQAPPLFPGGKLPPLILGLLTLGALGFLALGRKRGLGRGWLALRFAMVSLVLLLDLALVACRASTLQVSGTTTGNYTITVQGTMVSNTAVFRTATTNLSVTATPP